MYKIIPQLLHEAGRLTEEEEVPDNVQYSADMPRGPTYHDTRVMGLNAKQRKRIRAFERLSHLTNLGKYLGGEVGEEVSLSEQLSIMVKAGGQSKDIASAREQVARLHTIATTLYDEVHDLMTDSDSFGIKEEDQPHFEKLCDELSDLKKELHGRGAIGCSEPMKSAAAERMRSKLEAKMLPKLNADIPKWAERLRFLHSDVLKWSAPYRLLDEPAAVEDAAATGTVEEDYPEWEAPKESNPKPKGKELELLKAMGWGRD